MALDAAFRRKGIGLEYRRFLVEKRIGESGEHLALDEESAVTELQILDALGTMADCRDHPTLLFIDTQSDVLERLVVRDADDGRAAAAEAMPATRSR